MRFRLFAALHHRSSIGNGLLNPTCTPARARCSRTTCAGSASRVVSQSLDERYRRVLARQLAMTEITWRRLQDLGVMETTQVCLDFAYLAPNRASADALRLVLTDETDYDATVQSSGGLFARRWTLTGSTRPTTISPAILNQWVDWMVTAGLHQNCEFDGWGVQA